MQISKHMYKVSSFEETTFLITVIGSISLPYKCDNTQYLLSKLTNLHALSWGRLYEARIDYPVDKSLWENSANYALNNQT